MISTNPKLHEKFYCTPNEQRSKTQLIHWWNNPFITNHGHGFDVYCLDGGAWDRPTLHAHYDTFSQALSHAETLKETLKEYRFKDGDSL